MSLLMLGLELYFAAMLGISGLAKLDHPEYFADTLRRHRILPSWSINAISRIVSWLEVILALCLAAGLVPLATAIMSALLFASFLIIETILVVTKRATMCGCYGLAYPQKVDRASIIVSLTLTALAVFHVWLITWLPPISIGERLVVLVPFLVISSWLVWRIIVRHRDQSQELAVRANVMQLKR